MFIQKVWHIKVGVLYLSSNFNIFHLKCNTHDDFQLDQILPSKDAQQCNDTSNAAVYPKTAELTTQTLKINTSDLSN